MAKMSKAAAKKRGAKIWAKRRKRYGKDGLSPKGLRKIRAANKQGKRKVKKKKKRK
jgi:hypothetical protein